MAHQDKFYQALRDALENFSDPAWLGANSPLAAPYFLGKYLVQHSSARSGRRTNAEETWSVVLQTRQLEARGKVLRALLREAVKALPPHPQQGQSYYQALIELRYFQPQKISVADFSQHLPEPWSGSRAAYYNHLTEAIQLLEEALVQQLNPSLRLEPVVRSRHIMGREHIIDQCLMGLKQGKKIRITGPGGIGKTALAASLTEQLSPQPVFWYTFHRGLNDRLNNLLFSLAFFLHEQGASEMWLQLVAGEGAGEDKIEGKVDNKVAFGLLRHALQTLTTTPPLLCFDEIDLLDPSVEAHNQILSFLNSLPEDIPTLLLGQRVPVEANLDLELPALSLADVRDLLVREDIHLLGANLARLHAFTQGNPRLLVLYLALHSTGETLPDVLETMTEAHSLEALLHRIWPKLHEGEQLLLQKLCVYRGAAPSDVWSDRTEEFYLHQLRKRQLIQIDEEMGVSLFSAYRAYIYNRLSSENRPVLHELAADARAARAEHTEAAYHLIEAQEPELAVQQWYPHQRAEVNQGQAETALALFDTISDERLSGSNRKILKLIRSSLRLLMGDYPQARQDLVPRSEDIFSIRSTHLEGDINEITGELDAAKLAYEEGLGTVENLLTREAILFHLDLGWLHRREMNSSKAWHETRLAEYEIEHLRGEILWVQGNLPEAKTHLLRAMELARDFDHARGEAKTANVLASLLSQQGEYKEAAQHWETAYQRFRGIGKLSSLPSVRVNQATGYVLAEQMQEAIKFAEEALRLFERFQEPYGVAVAVNTLAEAHLAVGNLESAEHFVVRIFESEDEYVIMDGLRIRAEIELARKNYADAQKFGQQSLELAKRHDDRYIEGYALRVLGKIYKAQQQDTKACEYLEQAIDIFAELELENEIEKTRRILDDLSLSLRQVANDISSPPVKKLPTEAQPARMSGCPSALAPHSTFQVL